MKTAQGTECSVSHDANGNLVDPWNVLEINGRCYTICAHRIGEHDFCGELIDVTDLPAVVICCGNERNHTEKED